MAATSALFRDRLAIRLREDLIGPLADDEVLTDRPSQRYSAGILYPLGSRIEPHEDEDGGLAVNEAEDAASNPEPAGVPLYAALKPSVAGLSFAVRPTHARTTPSVCMHIRCGTYQVFGVDDEGREVVGPPADRRHERWRRVAHKFTREIQLVPGEQHIDLGSEGVEGLELYVLVAPHEGVLTATAALANKRTRGDSRRYDEQQHFFQVELAVTTTSSCTFAPRPSRRAMTDEDSRTAALIYRDVVEHAVGHTCSARSLFGEDGTLQSVGTEWIPTVVVPAVSDRGDSVFDSLRDNPAQRPLEAAWLARRPSSDVVAGLEQLVTAYRQWIAREEQRIEQLPAALQPQAGKHIERCALGATRMAEGVAMIRDDPNVRLAFQLAQRAMRTQFWWSRSEELVWRPFQLGFQLLVLPSLADGRHPDRQIMDLLWFPTGGGKTEAYLALTAFVILLRRLRGGADEGAGVGVLMRYTLRLLTIQQFQRAAAMVCACEMLRRYGETGKDGIPCLGKKPIGIGLWVGAAATPLTLREALQQTPGDPATPKQLTTCPACGGELVWNITPTESRVECPAEASACEFAASGARLPIWTIDEEIYGHAPSLLIGTVDKFAQIVRKPETGVLFGRGTGNAPPDLIIQDELHLISGPLGSMAGLYEVAIDELCRRGDVQAKIIGSTATIRRAEAQIRALFDRDTYQFPAPGLDSANSGFAVIDEARPGRLYLGVTTAGRSATYMLQALAAALLQGASEIDALTEEADFYWTLVTYFNSLRELGHGLVLMQDDVPVSISQSAARRGETPRKVKAPAELTSRVPSYEIRDMLDRLKKRRPDQEAVDILLASNMISVGMDIPRLGLMLVNAQPKTLSEYIQATSRVGRGDTPGLIVTMYNSMRARDRSHYETFETWHRSLYRDVEATSVTPFASRAQDKALHAVLVALVRHTIPGMGMRPTLDDLRKPSVEEIAAVIEQRVARVDPSERSQVAHRLARLIDQWMARPDLQTYWDDYGRRTSLLMSAEQFAAQADLGDDGDMGGARRALWPTPNSMREVEPGTPFVLRNALRAQGDQDA